MSQSPQDPPPPALIKALLSARQVAVLTGAGMSAESGIPTFRDQLTGLWARFDPEALATPQAFKRDPETVWAWYESRRHLATNARPNDGHVALARLADLPQFRAFTVITQNVDDLHERAGSRQVIHLHGSLFSPRCLACSAPHEMPPDRPMHESTLRIPPPRCRQCGGHVRPGVVWFGEALPEDAWVQALAAVAQADLLLIVGTSGVVYPAASLPDAARRHDCAVAVINPDPDAAVPLGALCWQVSAGQGLPWLLSSAAND